MLGREQLKLPTWDTNAYFSFTMMVGALPVPDRARLVYEAMDTPTFRQTLFQVDRLRVNPLTSLFFHLRDATLNEQPAIGWLLRTLMGYRGLQPVAIRSLPHIYSPFDAEQLVRVEAANVGAQGAKLERLEANRRAHADLKKLQQTFYRLAKPYVHHLSETDQVDFYAHYPALDAPQYRDQAQARLKALMARRMRNARIPHITWLGYIKPETSTAIATPAVPDNRAPDEPSPPTV